MRIHNVVAAAALALAAVALALATPAASADWARGKSLYDAKCGGCHSESVHGRVKRDARDFEAVRAWVTRWNTSLALRWDADEVDDVAAYLNITYYGYPCPPAICRSISLAR